MCVVCRRDAMYQYEYNNWRAAPNGYARVCVIIVVCAVWFTSTWPRQKAGCANKGQNGDLQKYWQKRPQSLVNIRVPCHCACLLHQRRRTAFSEVGKLCTKLRNHLHDKTLATLYFLRAYYDNMWMCTKRYPHICWSLLAKTIISQA